MYRNKKYLNLIYRVKICLNSNTKRRKEKGLVYGRDLNKESNNKWKQSKTIKLNKCVGIIKWTTTLILGFGIHGFKEITSIKGKHTQNSRLNEREKNLKIPLKSDVRHMRKA